MGVVLSVVTQPSPTVSQPSTSQNEEKTPEMPKPKKNRCFMCRKKVGLTGMFLSFVISSHRICIHGKHLKLVDVRITYFFKKSYFLIYLLC